MWGSSALDTPLVCGRLIPLLSGSDYYYFLTRYHFKMEGKLRNRLQLSTVMAEVLSLAASPESLEV